MDQQPRSDCTSEAVWPVFCKSLKAAVKAWDQENGMNQELPAIDSPDKSALRVLARERPGFPTTRELILRHRLGSIHLDFSDGGTPEQILAVRNKEGDCRLRMGEVMLEPAQASRLVLKKALF